MFRGADLRSFNNGFPITGQEPFGFADLGDADRTKIRFKEPARPLAVERQRFQGLLANAFEGGRQNRPFVSAAASANRLAAWDESRECGGMVVLEPTGKLREFERLELGIGKTKRAGSGLCGKRRNARAQKDCNNDTRAPPELAGAPRQPKA